MSELYKIMRIEVEKTLDQTKESKIAQYFGHYFAINQINQI